MVKNMRLDFNPEKKKTLRILFLLILLRPKQRWA